jgi:hypothetical protein
MRMEATIPQKYQSSSRVLSKAAYNINKIPAVVNAKPKSNLVIYFSWWVFDIVDGFSLKVNGGQK